MFFIQFPEDSGKVFFRYKFMYVVRTVENGVDEIPFAELLFQHIVQRIREKELIDRRTVRAHLLTTCKAGGGILPDGSDRALFPKRPPDTSPEGAGNAASGHRLCSQLYILLCQQNDVAAYCHPIPPPVCENLPPAAFTQLCGCRKTRYPHFLF